MIRNYSADMLFAECFHERGPSASSGSSGSAEVTTSAGVASSTGGKRQLPLARGVLHVGANRAHEAETYAGCVGGGGANVVSFDNLSLLSRRRHYFLCRVSILRACLGVCIHCKVLREMHHYACTTTWRI